MLGHGASYFWRPTLTACLHLALAMQQLRTCNFHRIFIISEEKQGRSTDTSPVWMYFAHLETYFDSVTGLGDNSAVPRWGKKKGGTKSTLSPL